MVLITAKIPHIWVFHGFILALLNMLPISLLIGKMLLKVFLDRPVTHIAFKECVVLSGL